MSTYKCSKCGEEKDETSFYNRKVCKDCTIKQSIVWYKSNKDKVSLIKRKHMLFIRYGITLEEYNELFELQEGKCLICGTHEKDVAPGPFGIKRLCVDHDHNTGKIRGLLCNNCNSKLGWYEINKDNIKEYLNK